MPQTTVSRYVIGMCRRMMSWFLTKEICGQVSEALAQCTQTRQDLRDTIAQQHLDPQRVPLPADGASYRF